MKVYKTIQKEGYIEEEIKKSRFICYLKRVQSEEEARQFIQAIKKEHHKANHNCSAFILGEEASSKRSSDDGEPSGTAGIPILTVLENHGLTNVVAVVTRYFGGIKLGAGGLIRAYAGAVSRAVKEIGMVEIKELEGIRVILTYAQYQDLGQFLIEHQLREIDTCFTDRVETLLFVEPHQVEALKQSLIDYFHGKVQLAAGPKEQVELLIS